MDRTRLLLPLALLLGALAVPATAGASFQAGIISDREVGITGTDDVESIAISAAGSLFVHDQTSPGFASPFDFDTRTPGTQSVTNSPHREIFVVDGEGGDDTIQLVAAGASLRADGGEGGDTIVGGPDHDVIQGASGDDVVTGRQARDVIYLGAGDDTYQWAKASSADDDVDGGDGDDSIEMIGSPSADVFTVMGFASRVDVSVSGVTGDVSTTAIERLDLSLLDGNDVVEQELPPASLRFDIDAGPGDDALVGGPGPDVLVGREGTDEVRGAGGDDMLSAEHMLAGPGNDRMTAELWSSDVTSKVRGDGGYDVARVIAGGEDDPLTVLRKSPYVRVQGPAFGVLADSEALVLETGAGDDIVKVQPRAGIESAIAIDGGRDDDVLRGSDGLEWLAGGAGEDAVEGGPAPDRLEGGADFDILSARDGAPDAIACHEGTDVVFADAGDVDRLLDAGACEAVERASFAGATPLARVLGADELRLGSGVVRVPVACSAGARGGCEGTVNLVTADPVDVGGIAAPALLGRQDFALAPGTTAEVAVPVADRDDLVRAAGTFRPAVQAQVLTPLAQHTTQLPLDILK